MAYRKIGGAYLKAGAAYTTKEDCCCAETTCPAPVMLCETAGASLNKCGIYGFIDTAPPRVYLVSHIHLEQSGETYDFTRTFVRPACSHSDDDAGTEHYSWEALKAGDTYSVPSSDSEQGYSMGGADYHESLSNEYTTDLLIEDTIDAVPAFTGDWSGGCGALTDLSDDETACTIQKFRYKLALVVPSSGYLKAIWQERLTPDGSAPLDTPRSYTLPGGLTPGDALESEIFSVTVPTTRGMITIEDFWWTCVPDAEPTGSGTP